MENSSDNAGDLVSDSSISDRSSSLSQNIVSRWWWIIPSLGLFIYLFVVPLVALALNRIAPAAIKPSQVLTELSLFESIRLQSVSAIIMLIFLSFGASVGSFLNVLIYRLPRYRQLLWPPSSCPGCSQRIQGKDNIPIVGWLRLGGRCRECNIAIPLRYPLIEVVVAAIFVLFLNRELLSGGANLPIRPPNIYNGIVWILLYTKWDLVTLYLYHMSLLVLLLAWGMINRDGFKVPRTHALLAVVTMGLLSALFPHLNPTNSEWTSFSPSAISPAICSAVVGGGAGCFIGWLLSALPINGAMQLARPASADKTTSDLSLSDGDLICDPTGKTKPQNKGYMTTPETTKSQTVVNLIGGAESTILDYAEKPDLYGTPAIDPIQRSDLAKSLALVGVAVGMKSMLIILGLLFSILCLRELAKRLKGLYSERSSSTIWPATLLIFWASVALLFWWRWLYESTALSAS